MTHHQSLCHTLGISDLGHLTIRCCSICLSYQSPSSLSISGKLIIRSFQAKLSHSLLQLSSAQTQGKICNHGNVELSFDLGHGTVNQINCVPSCATLFIFSTFHSLFKVTSSCTGMHLLNVGIPSSFFFQTVAILAFLGTACTFLQTGHYRQRIRVHLAFESKCVRV